MDKIYIRIQNNTKIVQLPWDDAGASALSMSSDVKFGRGAKKKKRNDW